LTDTYLTAEEVRALTGAAQVPKQIEYLRARGWCHTTDRFGKPKILRKYHDAMLTGTNTTADAFEPNYGAFDGR
jgi:hypothetical protein